MSGIVGLARFNVDQDESTQIPQPLSLSLSLCTQINKEMDEKWLDDSCVLYTPNFSFLSLFLSSLFHHFRNVNMRIAIQRRLLRDNFVRTALNSG